MAGGVSKLSQAALGWALAALAGSAAAPSAQSLNVDQAEIEVVTGGLRSFHMQAGVNFGGGLHVLLGSTSGTDPGQQVGPLLLPLNPDAYFFSSLISPGGFLGNSIGPLDCEGRAFTTLSLPPGLSLAFSGSTLHHASLVLGSAGWPPLAVTPAVELALESPQSGLHLVQSSVVDGSIWPANRAIELRFDRDVDFSSITANALRLIDTNGLPAIGSFLQLGPRRVGFVPRNPIQSDLSDTGLKLPGTTYTLSLLGGPFGVKAIDGEPLSMARTIVFQTPNSLDPQAALFDEGVGPPAPLLRTQGCFEPLRTHLYDEGSGARTYFELDPFVGTVSQPTDLPTLELSLQLYLDQPIGPGLANLGRLRLESADSPAGPWNPLPTQAVLGTNDSPTAGLNNPPSVARGAWVSVSSPEPLPGASWVRLVIAAGFEDLVGDSTLLPIDQFAIFRTR